MDLIVIPEEKVIQEKVSLKSRPVKKQKIYEAEKKEVSSNIRKFDKKVKKVHTENPYSYSSVSLKKPTTGLTDSANQMIANKTYNLMGKMLGIDTKRDWNKYYDKVYRITEWAKKRSGFTEPMRLMRWIKARRIPSVGTRSIEDIYIYASLQKQL